MNHFERSKKELEENYILNNGDMVVISYRKNRVSSVPEKKIAIICEVVSRAFKISGPGDEIYYTQNVIILEEGKAIKAQFKTHTGALSLKRRASQFKLNHYICKVEGKQRFKIFAKKG